MLSSSEQTILLPMYGYEDGCMLDFMHVLAALDTKKAFLKILIFIYLFIYLFQILKQYVSDANVSYLPFCSQH